MRTIALRAAAGLACLFAAQATAQFQYMLTIAPKPVDGEIFVFHKNGALAGLRCKEGVKVCNKAFPEGTVLRVDATPTKEGYVFKEWGGACKGQEKPRCFVTMDKSHTVSVVFSGK